MHVNRIIDDKLATLLFSTDSFNAKIEGNNYQIKVKHEYVKDGMKRYRQIIIWTRSHIMAKQLIDYWNQLCNNSPFEQKYSLIEE